MNDFTGKKNDLLMLFLQFLLKIKKLINIKRFLKLTAIIMHSKNRYYIGD